MSAMPSTSCKTSSTAKGAGRPSSTLKVCHSPDQTPIPAFTDLPFPASVTSPLEVSTIKSSSSVLLPRISTSLSFFLPPPSSTHALYFPSGSSTTKAPSRSVSTCTHSSADAVERIFTFPDATALSMPSHSTLPCILPISAFSSTRTTSPCLPGVLFSIPFPHAIQEKEPSSSSSHTTTSTPRVIPGWSCTCPLFVLSMSIRHSY